MKDPRRISGKDPSSEGAANNYPGKGDAVGDNQGIQPTGSPPKSATLATEGKGGSLEKVIKLRDTSDGLPSSLSTKTFNQGNEDSPPSFSFDHDHNNKANGTIKRPTVTGS